jgi:hypothetical protein
MPSVIGFFNAWARSNTSEAAACVGPQNLLPACIEVGISDVTRGQLTGRLSAEHPKKNVAGARGSRCQVELRPLGGWHVSAPLK